MMEQPAATKCNRDLRIAAAVLAGGSARRIGGLSKGLIEIGSGVTIIGRLLAELVAAGVGSSIIVANRPALYRRFGHTVIRDRRRGAGPLAGIEAALLHYCGNTDATLFMPCDLPAISAAEINTLVAAFRESAARVVVAATGDDLWEPLCAVVRNDVVEAVSRCLDAGERRMRVVWQRAGALAVHFDNAAAFHNINNRQDLERWLAAR